MDASSHNFEFIKFQHSTPLEVRFDASDLRRQQGAQIFGAAGKSELDSQLLFRRGQGLLKAGLDFYKYVQQDILVYVYIYFCVYIYIYLYDIFIYVILYTHSTSH